MSGGHRMTTLRVRRQCPAIWSLAEPFNKVQSMVADLGSRCPDYGNVQTLMMRELAITRDGKNVDVIDASTLEVVAFPSQMVLRPLGFSPRRS